MPEQSNGLKLMGAVIATFVIIIIGISMVSTFFQAGNITNDETFDVYDPTVDQVCTLSNTAGGNVVVTYYDGVSWTVISSSDYTVDGEVVTVDADALA